LVSNPKRSDHFDYTHAGKEQCDNDGHESIYLFAQVISVVAN
jgi:hypothetical protein